MANVVRLGARKAPAMLGLAILGISVLGLAAGVLDMAIPMIAEAFAGAMGAAAGAKWA